jgi:hypothetical protein
LQTLKTLRAAMQWGGPSRYDYCLRTKAPSSPEVGTKWQI